MNKSLSSLLSVSLFALMAPLSSMAADPSVGCSTNSGLITSSGNYNMSFNGISRTFKVHVPSGYNRTTPSKMAMVFHGWGGNHNEFIGNKTVSREANQHGYILVAPKGLGNGAPDNSYNSWSFNGSTTGLDGDGGNGINGATCDYTRQTSYAYGSCDGIAENNCSWTHCQQSDLDFVVALTDHINNKMCIDKNNVFASGGSNGGMFTWNLGQDPVTAPIFRAIAPIIGLPHRGYLDGKGKNEDMPALLITGTRDATVPPGGWNNDTYTTTTDGDFFYYASATAITNSWAESHGCSVQGNASSFDVGYRKADCRTHCDEDQGWPRVLDCRSNMAHVYNFSWSWKLIMDFFDEHSI